MPGLIELLDSFNRKERFFLIGAALGNPDFRLSEDFCRQLGDAIGVAVPDNAFTAMDYHLDWIHASLFLSRTDASERNVFDNAEKVASGNQEDVDLLIAFPDGEGFHLILLEAKAATGWTNKQMKSKVERLSQIFGADGTKYPNVKPHFCLMSPRRPQQLNSHTWPSWMVREGKPIWLELRLPPERRLIARCDQDGKRSQEGTFFRVLKSWR